MTCKFGGTLDNYEECTCYFQKLRKSNSCEFYETCGTLEDFCSECCQVYDEAFCECTCPLCQQLACMDYENCKERSSTCGQYDRQYGKEHDAFNSKGKSQKSEYSCITCKHRRTPNSWKKSKNKETTDEQVRGKPEDQPAAAWACCPTCPQPMCICRQEGGRRDTKEKLESQKGEYSCMTCKHRRTLDNWKKSKNKETTDKQVRGKPEDQPTAAECACCPTCPQPMSICRQKSGRLDTKEKCKNQEGEYSCMTCNHRRTPDNWKKSKNKEITDEQARGKSEDHSVAAIYTFCPICLQPRYICRQECGGPDKGIHCPKITPENSRKLSAGARISKDPYGPEILVPYKDGQFSHFQLPTLCRIFLLPLV